MQTLIIDTELDVMTQDCMSLRRALSIATNTTAINFSPRIEYCIVTEPIIINKPIIVTIGGNDNSITIYQSNQDRLFIIDHPQAQVEFHHSIICGPGSDHTSTTIPPRIPNIIGGGIRIHNGKLKIRDCILVGNVSKQNGGAIYASGSVELINTTFRGNHTARNGGAIYVNLSKSHYLKMIDCTITNNSASLDGGGVCIRGSSDENEGVRMVNSIFNYNVCGRDGGAIARRFCESNGKTFLNAIINQCDTLNNIAGRNGGSISFNNKSNNDNHPIDSLAINHSSITCNTCLGDGGAIYFQTCHSTLDLNHCDIYENSANNGSAIISSNSNMRIDNCKLMHNISIDSNITNSAIVNTNSSIMTITSSTIANNIYLDDEEPKLMCRGIDNDSIIEIYDSVISNNSTNENGGGILHRGNDEILISNTMISSNRAMFGGGINNSGPISLYDCKIISNCADIDGGGIYGESLTNIRDSTIANNKAVRDGAGIFNNNNAVLRIIESKINYAHDFAGGICNKGQMDITDSLVSENHATLEDNTR